MEFLSLSRRRSSARNVPIGEEIGETNVFARQATHFSERGPLIYLKTWKPQNHRNQGRNEKGMGVQIYFQGCSKCTCVWSIFPSHLEGKFSVENREISSETLQRVLVFPKLLYLPQPLKCVMKSLSWASGLCGRRYVWRNDARQCWM